MAEERAPDESPRAASVRRQAERCDSNATFVSYARADAKFALRLATDLRSAGVRLWLDQLDIPAGEPWDTTISKAVERCASMLIILTPTAVENENVLNELSFALEEKKQIIPVMYRRCRMPLRIQRMQYVDFTGNHDEALPRLVQQLGGTSNERSRPSRAKAIIGAVLGAVGVLVAGLLIANTLVGQGDTATHVQEPGVYLVADLREGVPIRGELAEVRGTVDSVTDDWPLREDDVIGFCSTRSISAETRLAWTDFGLCAPGIYLLNTLNERAPITLSMVEVKEPVNGLLDDVPAATSDVVGMCAQRKLTAGTRLTWDDIGLCST